MGRKRGRSILSILILLFLLMILVVMISGLYVLREFKGKGKTGESIVISIPEGASTAQIATILEENGLIGNSLVFRAYSRIMAVDGSFTHGDHKVEIGSSYDDIIYTLQQTTYLDVETITVTFPEGTTALSMAYKLSDLGFCSVNEFINACNYDRYDVSFFNQIIKSEDKFVHLEGFLFPDTYEFVVGSSAHDIIQKMLENFEEKVLTPEVKDAISRSDLTLEETIIMASIVEKETLGDEMYSMVAGVFMNRLHNPDEFPCLESDTSTEHLTGNFIYGVLGFYYNGDADARVRNIPQNMIDAYDTYIRVGLPVGAICNPGYKAIMGTVNPESHNYYFFITDKDTNYYWGTTMWEHEQNINEVKRYNANH
ncbi:MAG: endolytic transglycosylase MltG [Oscillospiraceae bacterium]|nr:endolytic transglycosylase MltG [Oscillospiraceae bacterium]